MELFQPNDNDVFYARGNGANNTIGNIKYRRLIRSCKMNYQKTKSNKQKGEIAQGVIDIIKGHGGTFYYQSKKQECVGTQSWEVADDQIILEKVKQALREKKKNIVDEALLPLDPPQLPSQIAVNAVAAATTTTSSINSTTLPQEEMISSLSNSLQASRARVRTDHNDCSATENVFQSPPLSSSTASNLDRHYKYHNDYPNEPHAHRQHYFSQYLPCQRDFQQQREEQQQLRYHHYQNHDCSSQQLYQDQHQQQNDYLNDQHTSFAQYSNIVHTGSPSTKNNNSISNNSIRNNNNINNDDDNNPNPNNGTNNNIDSYTCPCKKLLYLQVMQESIKSIDCSSLPNTEAEDYDSDCGGDINSINSINGINSIIDINAINDMNARNDMKDIEYSDFEGNEISWESMDMFMEL